MINILSESAWCMRFIVCIESISENLNNNHN